MDLENISEEDLINALGDMSLDTKPIEKKVTPQVTNIPEELSEPQIEKTSSSIEIDSSSIDSLAMVLKELLQNKTIEITIKVKD